MNVDIGNNWDACEIADDEGPVPCKLEWEQPLSILEEAAAAIKVRQKQYGESSTHHYLTASFWSIYLGREVSSTEVAVMMVLDKIARQRNDPKYKDNYVDMAGYADRAGHNALGI